MGSITTHACQPLVAACLKAAPSRVCCFPTLVDAPACRTVVEDIASDVPETIEADQQRILQVL